MTDENALPTDYDFKDAEEYDRVVRVRSKDDVKRDEWSTPSSAEMMFWRDEDMAQRLAGYLKPPPDPRKMELPPRKEEVVMPPLEESKSRGFWGRKKSVSKVPAATPVERKVEPDVKMPSMKEEPEDKVVMDIRAEEVVFRTESDLGIYGTERGWGIVLKLKVILVGDRR